MFHYLYYTDTIKESKEKFKIVFCWFPAIKNILALSSSPNFSLQLICWGMFKEVYNNFDDKNNLINFMLYSYHFLIFQ